MYKPQYHVCKGSNTSVVILSQQGLQQPCPLPITTCNADAGNSVTHEGTGSRLHAEVLPFPVQVLAAASWSTSNPSNHSTSEHS
jgi:hypothetical protein